MKYLKNKQYYIDLYDEITVSRLRSLESFSSRDEEGKSEKEKVAYKMANDFFAYFEKGEAYLRKEDTIRKWMDADREKDRLIETASIPEVSCDKCDESLVVDLVDIGEYAGNQKVFFFLLCRHCKKKKAVWEGSEKMILGVHCPECRAIMESTSLREGDTITSQYVCPSCDYQEKDSYTLNETKGIDPNFERDRKRYCLSDDEGAKYISGKANLESLAKFGKKMKEKEEKKDLYDKVVKLEKLTVAQVQARLQKTLGENKYSDLSFTKPEFGKYVTVEFTCIEQDAGRSEYDSKVDLKKIIEQTLLNTVWRLMSSGVEYRMGYLSGRIKAYEKEEDLLKLVE